MTYACTCVRVCVCACVRVCANQIMEEFYNIFGDELKSVTGNPTLIDNAIASVNTLVDPITQLDYDPFDPVHEKDWEKVTTNVH